MGGGAPPVPFKSRTLFDAGAHSPRLHYNSDLLQWNGFALELSLKRWRTLWYIGEQQRMILTMRFIVPRLKFGDGFSIGGIGGGIDKVLIGLFCLSSNG